jgi:metal-dependent HD superfamily phosphatase/phosphodiesterase
VSALLEEVEVNPSLINKHLEKYELVRKANEILSKDTEYNVLIEMANINAVKRLLYNDHGPVHARIVAGSALEIFDRLLKYNITPTSIVHKTASSIEESALIVFLASMFHDIGNSVHRANHELVGALISRPILDRVLRRLFPKDKRKRIMIRQEVMNAVYSTAMEVQSLTIEGGIVKVADGTDMAMGRARYPYRMGKNDMHALSALSVQKVTITSDEKPVVINIYMKDSAGVFQIEQVLGPKINTSGLKPYILVNAYQNGRRYNVEY